MSKSRKLDIIYEDKDIIVIDKPAGMLSVSTDARETNTAYRALNEYLRAKRGRVWIVHRLDRDTSGVLLFAKNERAKSALQNNWEESVTLREYTAVVQGRVRESSGRIESWLRQTKAFVVYSCSDNRYGDAKLAVTHWRALAVAKSGKYSLLAVSLETGRKNQIRVHLKDIGHPIVGDKKYEATANPLRRLGLHATTLAVKHPTSGREMRFEAKMPDSFAKLF
jgi:23S rRNA pseudouridine1911/1915/1917 synthase